MRDADFTEAFSAIGHAVAAPERFAESLGNAYVAVFGGSGMQDAAEVGGGRRSRIRTEQTRRTPRPSPCRIMCSTRSRHCPFSYVSPLDGALTSGFGWREDPNTGEEAFHTGLDLAADEGTPFCLLLPTAQSAWGESTVLGKYLTVRHADGYETLYAHCSKIAVSSGQSVLRGDPGAVGATGTPRARTCISSCSAAQNTSIPLPMPQRPFSAAVRVNASFWLLVLLAAIVSPLTVVAAILTTARCTSWGIFAAMRYYGVSVKRFRLTALGAELDAQPRAAPMGASDRHARGGDSQPFSAPFSSRSSACGRGGSGPVFAGAHLVLAAFNLLPVVPLDGARALCLAPVPSFSG